ncbi:NAD(P)H-binding protein [Streptomyces sp. NPDC013178]|uniref:NAD(P)H-binding protein n=1 Tax=Streptomyces sp. NPDC013178 TaxID=3155118 RepID=UPI0033DA6753
MVATGAELSADRSVPLVDEACGAREVGGESGGEAPACRSAAGRRARGWWPRPAARGHEVTAVARDTACLGQLPGRVRAVAGDVTAPGTVAALARAADALVPTVGGPEARAAGRQVRTTRGRGVRCSRGGRGKRR